MDIAEFQQTLATAKFTPIEDLENRPVFILGPDSYHAAERKHFLNRNLHNIVAYIDDFLQGEDDSGVPYWSFDRLSREISGYMKSNPVALDFSSKPQTSKIFREKCEAIHLPCFDFTVAQLQFNNTYAVYETAQDYRQKTLDNLDRFMAFMGRLDDELSKKTLFNNLMFRLTGERKFVHQAYTDFLQEYFSVPSSENLTFAVGTKEHLVDCGAYHGTVIDKLLNLTGNQYQSITAFEPDPDNFRVISEKHGKRQRTRILNQATGKEKGQILFLRTGTMGSRIVPQGTPGASPVDIVRLDDCVDKCTFLKMDIEGAEPYTLTGGGGVIARERPRMAICTYHYATDFLEAFSIIDEICPGYHFRVRQHCPSYYYDLVLYASPLPGNQPLAHCA